MANQVLENFWSRLKRSSSDAAYGVCLQRETTGEYSIRFCCPPPGQHKLAIRWDILCNGKSIMKKVWVFKHSFACKGVGSSG